MILPRYWIACKPVFVNKLASSCHRKFYNERSINCALLERLLSGMAAILVNLSSQLLENAAMYKYLNICHIHVLF